MLKKEKRKDGFKTNEKFSNLKTQIGALVVAGSSMLVACPLADVQAHSVIKNAVAQILTLVGYIGIILAVWGAVQFFLALKNEDSDSKSRAGMTIVCGAALIGIKPIVNQLGLGMKF